MRMSWLAVAPIVPLMLKRMISIVSLGCALLVMLAIGARSAHADLIDRIDIENHSDTDVTFTIVKQHFNGSGCLKPGQSDQDHYIQKVNAVKIGFAANRGRGGSCGDPHGNIVRSFEFPFKGGRETFKAIGKRENLSFHVTRS